MMKTWRMVWSGLQAICVAWLTTGCAVFGNHRQPLVEDGYRAPVQLPIKAVEVRWTSKGAGVSVDSAARPLAAVFRFVAADGGVEEGVILPDATVHHRSVVVPMPQKDPGKEMALAFARGSHADYIERQIQAERNAAQAAALANLLFDGYDRLMSSRNYRKLQEKARTGMRSFDVAIIHDDGHTNARNMHTQFGQEWAVALGRQARSTGLAEREPVLVLATQQVQRIAAFEAAIRRDFPSARLELPVQYLATEYVMSTVAPSDLVLSFDVAMGLNEPLALAILNGMASAMTFGIIPFAIPTKGETQIRLRTKDGRLVATEATGMSCTMWIGIPMVAWAFQEEHKFPQNRAYAMSLQFIEQHCRILVKEIAEAAQSGNLPARAGPAE